MRPTDVIFNNLNIPTEEHAAECPACSKARDAILRCMEEVARIQDASDFAKLTVQELCVGFNIKVIVNPDNHDEINVSIEGIADKSEPLVEVPSEQRTYTLDRRAQDVTDAILKLWSGLFTCNDANERIGKMYDEFEAIQEGEHAPASSYLN